MTGMDAAIEAAVVAARESTPTMRTRTGTVKGSDSTDYVVFVVMDGDPPDQQTHVQALNFLPAVDERVVVLFVPPRGAICLGVMGPDGR